MTNHAPAIESAELPPLPPQSDATILAILEERLDDVAGRIEFIASTSTDPDGLPNERMRGARAAILFEATEELDSIKGKLAALKERAKLADSVIGGAQ